MMRVIQSINLTDKYQPDESGQEDVRLAAGNRREDFVVAVAVLGLNKSRRENELPL